MTGEELKRTVEDGENVDTGHGKAFGDAVVRTGKLALHDGQVDLDEDDAAHTAQYHPWNR
jgi:hypothetical protein